MVQIKLKLVFVILAVAVVSPTGTSALPLPGHNDPTGSSQDHRESIHDWADILAQVTDKFVPAPGQGTVRPAE